MATPNERIGLVGCVKLKREAPAAAKDLYVSPLFRGRRRFVERTCARWFILSARHGVLEPSQPLAPYELTLKTASAGDRRRWADNVLRQLEERLGAFEGLDFEVHAGAEYRDYGLIAGLESRGARVEVPARGLSQGQQLAFYAKASAVTTPPRAADRRPTTLERPACTVRHLSPGAARAPGGGAYQSIGDFLRNSPEPEVALSFATLEKILNRPLPASARRHRPWWSNSTTGHSHARAWLDAGWRVAHVDMAAGAVRFALGPSKRSVRPAIGTHHRGLRMNRQSAIWCSDAIADQIASEYERLGHTLGWRWLASAWSTLETSPVAIVTINPGGDVFEAPVLAVAPGRNAYVDESWNGEPVGESSIQRRMRALYRLLGVQPHEALTGHLIPFRSREQGTLPRYQESLTLGMELWRDIFARRTFRAVVAIGNAPASALVDLLGAHDYEKTDAGHGTWTLGRWTFTDGQLVRLPHLSRYALDTPERERAVYDWLTGGRATRPRGDARREAAEPNSRRPGLFPSGQAADTHLTFAATRIVNTRKPALVTNDSTAGRIRIVGDASFRAGSARAEYWALVKQWDGYRYCDAVTLLEARPPKLPASGVTEAGTGWLNFFHRQGLIEISDQPVDPMVDAGMREASC